MVLQQIYPHRRQPDHSSGCQMVVSEPFMPSLFSALIRPQFLLNFWRVTEYFWPRQEAVEVQHTQNWRQHLSYKSWETSGSEKPPPNKHRRWSFAFFLFIQVWNAAVKTVRNYILWAFSTIRTKWFWLILLLTEIKGNPFPNCIFYSERGKPGLAIRK